MPFRDPAALARQVIDLLDNEARRHAMRKRAYLFGRTMIWPQVARRYKEFIKFNILTLNGKAVQNKGMAFFPRKIDDSYVMLFAPSVFLHGPLQTKKPIL